LLRHLLLDALEGRVHRRPPVGAHSPFGRDLLVAARRPARLGARQPPRVVRRPGRRGREARGERALRPESAGVVLGKRVVPPPGPAPPRPATGRPIRAPAQAARASMRVSAARSASNPGRDAAARSRSATTTTCGRAKATRAKVATRWARSHAYEIRVPQRAWA